MSDDDIYIYIYIYTYINLLNSLINRAEELENVSLNE